MYLLLQNRLYFTRRIIRKRNNLITLNLLTKLSKISCDLVLSTYSILPDYINIKQSVQQLSSF